MKTLLTIGRLMFGIAASLVLVAGALGQSSGSPQSKPAARQLTTEAKPWTGDFGGMLERRVIRVLVPGTGKPR